MLKLFIEKEARENILAYLTNESLINTPEYNLLWLEYLTLMADIQSIRKEFFNNIVLSYIPKDQNFNNLFWNLDYDKGELRIYEQ